MLLLGKQSLILHLVLLRSGHMLLLHDLFVVPALLLEASKLLILQSLAVEAHVVVIIAANTHVDVKDKCHDHSDLVDGDGPVAVDFPGYDHIFDSVNVITIREVCCEDQDLIVEEKRSLDGSGADHTESVPLSPQNRVLEEHEAEDDARESDHKRPQYDRPVPVVMLGRRDEQDHVVDEETNVDRRHHMKAHSCATAE